MLVAKQVADFITVARALLAVFLVWLGFTQKAVGLPLAVWTMIIDWSGDALDGPIARRSRVFYHTWIGDHDLQIDMLVSVGLLVYMLAAGFVEVWVAGVYLLIWLMIFWRWGATSVLGMLFQAPIYGWFVWVALREVSSVGIWLIVWMAVALIATWPKFLKTIVPGFLGGMREVLKNKGIIRKD